jgi:hypothetical protein
MTFFGLNFLGFVFVTRQGFGVNEHPANPHLRIEMWGTRLCGSIGKMRGFLGSE